MLASSPYSAIVDEFAFLPLLHLLDQQAKLLLHLIERLAVEVGDARLHVEHGRDGLEEIFARGLLIIDEGLGQVRIGVARRAALDVDAACPPAP